MADAVAALGAVLDELQRLILWHDKPRLCSADAMPHHLEQPGLGDVVNQEAPDLEAGHV